MFTLLFGENNWVHFEIIVEFVRTLNLTTQHITGTLSSSCSGLHDAFMCVSVCQETVWEAFKIFWDRLPEREEYQDWVGRCMDGSVSVKDIGSVFSKSEEHSSLIQSVSNTIVRF